MKCPYGQPGDQLWVRETCRAEELPDGMDGVRYLADHEFIALRPCECAVDRWLDMRDYGKRPSPVSRVKTVPAIHMPRWASRITLEITGVRVERLQEINETDASAEGVDIWGKGALSKDGQDADPSDKFRWLWGSINGPDSWSANPWVWVVEFKRIAV